MIQPLGPHPLDSTPNPGMWIPTRYDRNDAPPGPVEKYPFQQLFLLRREGVLAYMRHIAYEYGSIARIRFGRVWLYQVNNPEYIKAVLQKDHRSFVKGYAADAIRDLAGFGLLTSEGELHRRQHRLMQPAFRKNHLQDYSIGMLECFEEVVGKWCEGVDINLTEEMSSLTMKVVLRSLFSSSLDDGEKCILGEAMEELVELIVDRILSPWGQIRQYMPAPATLRFKRSLARVNKTIYKLISTRQKSGQFGSDLLGLLLGATDEDGSGMPLRQLRDEAITLFIAGHETTSVALGWAWYELARDPELQMKLHLEVDSVLGGRKPTFDDIEKLVFCRQVFQESLRHYPPLYLIFRQALEDYQLGKYTIPKGGLVTISPYIIHHDSAHYACPDKFYPERWTEEFRDSLHKFAFIPFGGGPRVCIGEHFAWTEGILALAFMAQRYNIHLRSHQDIRPGISGSLRPNNPIQIRVTLRGVSSQTMTNTPNESPCNINTNSTKGGCPFHTE